MSYNWLKTILPLKIPAHEKHVLTIMAHHTNQYNECWVGVPLLATECGYSERQIQRILRKLTKGGFISAQPRTGHSTIYSISLIGGDMDVTTGGDTGVTHNSKLNVHEEKCYPRKCKTWHMECTAIMPPYIMPISRRRRASHVIN